MYKPVCLLVLKLTCAAKTLACMQAFHDTIKTMREVLLFNVGDAVFKAENTYCVVCYFFKWALRWKFLLLFSIFNIQRNKSAWVRPPPHKLMKVTDPWMFIPLFSTQKGRISPTTKFPEEGVSHLCIDVPQLVKRGWLCFYKPPSSVSCHTSVVFLV